MEWGIGELKSKSRRLMKRFDSTKKTNIIIYLELLHYWLTFYTSITKTSQLKLLVSTIMTQQNMVRMVTIDKRSNKSLTLALNSTFEMTSHSWTTFKFAILNSIFSYVNIYFRP